MTDFRKKEFKDTIEERPIVIWGARMTGIGVTRYALSNGIKVLAFIDSDTALHGNTVSGVKVDAPENLYLYKENNPNLLLIVAVSIKEAEIMLTLDRLGLNDLDHIIFSEYSDVFYTVDIVGTCNLKCLSCAHSIKNHSVPRGIMRFDNFKRVVDKIVDEARLVTHISLYSWGEPFLHPDLNKIIKYLHERNIAVALSSNLSIRNTDLIDKVIAESPDYLKISTSGYYENAYDNTHSGGDVNLVKSNLYRLRHLVDKYQANTFVDVNYHLYRDNNGINLDKMTKLCEELGFALSTVHALVMPLERVIKHCDGESDYQTQRLSENLLVNIDEGISASNINKTMDGKCSFRENQLNINADLSVPVCCTVFSRGGNVVADNYLESTPTSIKKGKDQAEICKKCMELGLPDYNMGFNRQKWLEIASTKKSLDVGSLKQKHSLKKSHFLVSVFPRTKGEKVA